MKRHPPSARTLTCAIAILVAGCGSGGMNTGIDGTGIHSRDIVSLGRARIQQSLVVNGQAYDTSRATVLVDGTAASPSDIDEGDVALIEGSIDVGSGAASAVRITADHVVQGVITGIDGDASLQVLGQRVQVGPDAVFAASLPARVDSLRTGDAVSISGFRDADGRVIATRVEAHAPGAMMRTTGAVSSISLGQSQLRINDLTVDFKAATLSPANALALIAPGTFVEVSGMTPVSSGVLVADALRVRRQSLPATGDVSARLEGYVTRLNAADATRFELQGLPVTLTSTTSVTGTIGTGGRLDVEGAVDTNGAVRASLVQSTIQVPLNPAILSGRVFEAGAGPVADANVQAYIQQPNGSGYSLTWMRGGTSLMTDAAGRFEIRAVSGSTLIMSVYKTGYVMPCAVIRTATDGGSLELELVPRSTLASSNAPLPLTAATAPVLSGVVFETVGAVRQPIADASLWVGDSMGITYAYTATDRGGRYAMCNLPQARVGPWGRELWVQKAGYADSIFDAYFDAFPPLPSVFDIELRRKP